MGTRVDRHAVTLAIRADAARRQVGRDTGVQARVTADSLYDSAFCEYVLRADKWVGRRAGRRVIRPRRPGDRGGGHVDVPCVHTHGGRADWVARCTGTQTTHTHSNQIGHSLDKFSQPPPLTPHPVPGILCFTHAPRTPHPTPSTLYPIGFRGPRALDTTTRLCGEGEGHSNGNFFLLLLFSQAPALDAYAR